MIKHVLAGLAVLALVACGEPENYPIEGEVFIDPGAPIGVVLETAMGDIHIDVYPERAPLSSRDFLYYVDKGLYENQGFYRVVTPENDNREMGMSLIQGGRLDLEDLTLVPHESTKETGLSNSMGSLALARQDVGTGSAAFFFINLDNNAMLNHGGARNPDGQGFAVFGRVTEGLDVAFRIQKQRTYGKGEAENQPPAFQELEDQLLVNPVFIKRAYRK